MLPYPSTQWRDIVVLCAFIWITNCMSVESGQASGKLLARLKDPAFQCQSNLDGKGPNIFQVLDCDAPGARWDYNYKV